MKNVNNVVGTWHAFDKLSERCCTIIYTIVILQLAMINHCASGLL